MLHRGNHQRMRDRWSGGRKTADGPRGASGIVTKTAVSWYVQLTKASTEGETIVQVHGIGPFSVAFMNPADDPRNQKPR